MISPQVLMVWDRQREAMREAERERRARVLLETARARVAQAISALRMT
jgi:hypothetical protein